ncbi:hypothetical protein H5410_011445 [Solanum commersonii]|uniref:CTP synthase (glutamine hydrolyzing) n=1 Tax=Solanum commersonii TaxID=4109 RepID=A0A9J6APN7_SOLCO|nr:hypothetical protein H5410_011445 [Solanum commersonii]
MFTGLKAHMRGNMCLGSRRTYFQVKDSKSAKLYLDERHRHRYEVNTDMVQQFEDAVLSFTGKDESGRCMGFHQVYVSIGIGTCYVKVDDSEPPFKIVDIERSVFVSPANLRIFPIWLFRCCKFVCSEDDLLCTRASPSLLPLLSSGFGIPLSSLNNLFSEDGSFLLSGYILGPDVYTVKVNRPKLMDKEIGFGDRCVEGKILAAKYARGNWIPYLGVQIVVIKYAISILGLQDVNSTEFDPNTDNPWGSKAHMRGTMCLGSRRTHFQVKDSKSAKLSLDERHHHKYEVNPDMVPQFKDAGLSFIGKDESGRRMEFTPSLSLTLFPPGICCYRLETCYVKVDDDGSSEVVLSFEGSGVSQDGLVLMGKRFASLLEIVTKTHGMPNGYRKVLKDSKCLYLGIDNCRQENLKNYLIPQAMLFSKLFHFTIARRSSLPRVSLHERQQEIIKTVHDEPLMPVNNDRKCVQLIRAVRRLHHSAEAIWSELPWMSSHQCDQSSTPSTGDSVFSDVR